MSGSDTPAEIQFSNELLAVFVRWQEESDLTPLEMAEVAAIVINNFCNEETIEFEPDQDLIDRLDEEEDV